MSRDELDLIRERLNRPASPFALKEWADALLREVDRLRAGVVERRDPPEPMQWNEEAPTDDEVDGWSAEASDLWGILHAALDRLPDEITGPDNPAYMVRLERAYNALPAICRLRAGALRAGGPAREEPPDWAYQANTISVNLVTAWKCRDWHAVEVAATQLAVFRDRLQQRAQLRPYLK